MAYVPKPTTSNAKAEGRFDKADFIYIAKDDEYQCPAGQRAIYRFTREEGGLQLALLEQRLPSMPDEAPVHAERLQTHLTLGTRAVLDAMQRRLDRKPDAMTLRRAPSNTSSEH